MYKIVKVQDTVRVPPNRFGEDLNSAVVSELGDLLPGRVDKALGLILAVDNAEIKSEGKIIQGDGAVYFSTLFDILVYQPMLHEVVEGTVSEITEFGAFVNFGPVDGLIHVSQITEDFMSYDQNNQMFLGKESGRSLKVGDVVRARIVTISLKDRISTSKIGLTMRQPYLGKLEWIEAEKTAQKEGKKPEAAKKESKPKGKKDDKKEDKK
ncbi:DNA-directed RNA polymerase subunit E' [uncultured archaeon]|nr:DNA-directed RNA polymerase subunit E' [uncultured archaeon]